MNFGLEVPFLIKKVAEIDDFYIKNAEFFLLYILSLTLYFYFYSPFLYFKYLSLRHRSDHFP